MEWMRTNPLATQTWMQWTKPSLFLVGVELTSTVNQTVLLQEMKNESPEFTGNLYTSLFQLKTIRQFQYIPHTLRLVTCRCWTIGLLFSFYYSVIHVISTWFDKVYFTQVSCYIYHMYYDLIVCGECLTVIFIN